MSAMAVAVVAVGGNSSTCLVDIIAGAANWLWAAIEGVRSLITSGQGTALLLVVCHADSWELRCSMMLSGVMVNLMDRNCGVDNMWLDSLLVDDWLNGLVDMVVHVLASSGWLSGCGVLTLYTLSGILELGGFAVKGGLDLAVVIVLKVSVLNTNQVVMVLLWENLLVVHGLDASVVVILVHLLVNGGSHSVLLVSCDCLVLD